ncbi:mucin-3A-like [Silurus meridionalis]|uniref:mucin-3A-like n=1 Tax=Silurus meridionalis TaxID=175797 RepID=UPI001EEBA3CA|nr:mucin-3A-like [Silurus meridionalis]
MAEGPGEQFEAEDRLEFWWMSSSSLTGASAYTSPTLTPTTTLVQTSPGSPTTIDGSAVVNVRMVFHNSTSVPSEDVVLSDFKAMLNSTLSKFPNSHQHAEDPALRNDTYTQVKVLINDTVNTVLNNSGTQRPVELTSYNLKSLGDQVTGYMEYSLQSFLSQPENDTSPTLTPTTTLVQTSPGSPTTIDGSAVVNVRMVFHNSTSVPSEDVVLSDFKAMLNSTLSKFPNSVTVQNVTYEPISNTSFAVLVTFSISSISMPEDPALRNDTYTQVKVLINDTVNTVLNNSGTQRPVELTSYNLKSLGDQVTGYMEYSLQSFLSQPENDTSPTLTPTTTLVQTSPGSPTTIIGSAVIQTKLVFNVSSPGTIENVLPGMIKSMIKYPRQNVSEALSLMQILLLSAFPNLAEPLGVLDYSYEKISDTFLVVNITFTIKNIIMPENPELRDGTYTQMKNIINNAINYLTEAQLVEPITYNFLSSGDQVNGYMEYSFEQIPSQTANDNKVLKQPSTESPTTTDGSTLNPTTRLEQTSPESPTIIDGSAVVYVRMVFKTTLLFPVLLQI